MTTIIFIFKSEDDQMKKRSLVMDVIYDGLGLQTSINVEQKINHDLEKSMVDVDGTLFPLFNELSSKDIICEIN